MAKTFYFLLIELNSVDPCNVNYQDPCVILAQGFKKMNIEYSGNIFFFPYYDTNKYLINKKDIHLVDKTDIIISCQGHMFKKELEYFCNNGNKIVLINNYDQWQQNSLISVIPLCDIMFLSTYKTYFIKSIKPILYPFAFCNTDRLMKLANEVDMSKWFEREQVILEAHREASHTIRNLIKSYYAYKLQDMQWMLKVKHFNDKFNEPNKELYPEDYFHWCQTGRRHNMTYYNEMKNCQMMDAHGGYILNDGQIIQVDSWKLWEGFAMGCLVITADFKYYNIKLPFDLIGYVHYIPIRYNNIEESYNQLSKLSLEQKFKIALQGRKYVLENYCSESIAKYFINKL
jgi:hypothetical protein